MVIVLTTLTILAAAEWGVRRIETTLAQYDSRWQLQAYLRKPADLSRRPMPDIILMGSSRAFYAFVPEVYQTVLEMPAYNLAIAGSKTAEWQSLARRLLFPRPPRLVVLGVNAGEFQSNHLSTQGAEFLFDLDEFIDACFLEGPSQEVTERYIERGMGRRLATLDRRFELRMYGQLHLDWLLPKQAQWSRELRQRVRRPVPPDGYTHPWAEGRRLQDLQQRIDRGQHRNDDRYLSPDYAPDAPAFRRLDRLLAEFRRHAIPVALAYIPNSPETERRWRDVEPDMIRRIEEVCRGRGVPFIDCHQAPIPRTNRHYVDEIHTGLPLARTLSRYVAENIKSLDILDPRPLPLTWLDPEQDPTP